MAILNGLYIHVTDERVQRQISSSEHPVESGINITDSIRRKPYTVSLTGKIVDYNNRKAIDIYNKIIEMQKAGTLATYSGRNTVSNVQIQNFTTTHPNTNKGGLDFSMELKEIRIAKNSYTENDANEKQAGVQQVSNGDNDKVYHTVKKGDTVWALVTGSYKSLKPSLSSVSAKCDWIIKQNPSAFSRPGDARTMQIGAKLYVGYR